jgi:hypothetical protein
MLKSIGNIAEMDTNVEDPIVILTLDSSNAFNSLKRAHLISVLRQGCEQFVGPEQCSEDGKVIGWDILWRHIEANYGVHGVLKFFHNGEVDEVLSEAGVQQGDPLGSVLYALAIHPALLRIGRRFGEVFVGGYADNISLAGRLSIVAQAYEMYEQEMTNLGLTINPLESEIYVPQWKNNNLEQLESELVTKQHGKAHVQLTQGIFIPLTVQGIKMLGCPMGEEEFCINIIQGTVAKIEKDLDLLVQFPFIHQQVKMAIYCSNTRANYLLRATDLNHAVPQMRKLDTLVDRFMAHTLCFEANHEATQYGDVYAQAIKQVRLGIKQGGIGLASNELIAPAASYVALRDFTYWYAQLVELWGDRAFHHVSGLSQKTTSLELDGICFLS